MIAKLQMYLNDTSRHPAAKAEVALFLSDKVYPLETARLDIGRMPFKEMVEFVGSWSRRAQESRIILNICQDIAAELVYGAYWNCNPAQVQIRAEAPGMASVHLIFTGDVSADIEIATIQKEQVAKWMLWTNGVTDIPDMDKGLLTVSCDGAFGDFKSIVKEAVSLLPLETTHTPGGENGRL
jgi:hypothetical protein